MSITPAMKAAARAAYRDLYRASSVTFAGDDHVLKAFRMKMRNDAIAARAIVDPETYDQQTQLGREVADILRKNVVQGMKVSDDVNSDTFRLRLTKYTELGENESIKDPSSAERQDRRAPVADVAPHNNSFTSSPSHLPMNFSQLKKAHGKRVMPELKEEDLEEKFVRGSGPGGQSINKTENNVQLLHKPSGIRVSCQETRSLTLNRRLARRNLLHKLDKIANPGLSKEEFERAKQRERERRRKKKAKKKALEKAIQQDEGKDFESDFGEKGEPEEEASEDDIVKGPVKV